MFFVVISFDFMWFLRYELFVCDDSDDVGLIDSLLMMLFMLLMLCMIFLVCCFDVLFGILFVSSMWWLNIVMFMCDWFGNLLLICVSDLIWIL